MNQYIYLILGTLLGLGIVVYIWIDREEKIEKRIKSNQKIYSTKKLDEAMKIIVEKIDKKMKKLNRELTEEEKNEIIVESYKENFLV